MMLSIIIGTGASYNLVSAIIEQKERALCMDFNVVRQGVCVNDLIYEGSLEQADDSDITLPDYCPDIQRILKCLIVPQVTGTQASGGRITVDGAVLIRLIYVCEQGRIHCFEQTHPFSRFVEVQNMPEEACAQVQAKTEYVNCRAVSQRRIDVHASVTLMIKAVAPRSEELIDQAEGCGVQIRRSCVPVSSVQCCVQRGFTVSEVMELGRSQPPIAQIITSCASVRVQDIKVIPNKILLKGELEVRTLYCSEDGNSQAEKITNCIPISQILEADGIGEDCRSDVRLEVACLEVTPKSDAEGELRLLDITARICASVCAYVDAQAPMVMDAYSTAYELSAERKIVRLARLTDTFSDTALCRGALEVPGSGVSSVMDLWSGGITVSVSVRDGQLVVSGTVTVCMLLIDSGGDIQYLERQTDYEYLRRLENGDVPVNCDPVVRAGAMDYVLSGESKVDVRIELTVTASIFEMVEKKVVTQISLMEDQPKKTAASALTIYYCDAGENVWDIAVRYNTTVQAIMGENQLADETVPEKCMLLIPSA